MSLKNILLEFNAQEYGLANKLGQFIARNGFTIYKEYNNHKNKVGNGMDSIVFYSPKYPKYVLRASQNKRGFDKLDKLIGKKFDNVVEIFFNKEFQTQYNIAKKIYISVMEKLEEPENDVLKSFLTMINIMSDETGKRFYSHSLMKKYIDGTNFIPWIYERAHAGELSADSVDMKKYFDDIKAGYEQLKSIGIEHIDLHAGNVMYDPKSDNYKLIDIT